MSIKIMSAVWENGPQEQSLRFVLLALADYANDDGECWPSVGSVAKKTCLTERGVRKIIGRLEEGGWVEKVIGGGRQNSNLYRVKTLNVVPPERGSPLNVVPKNPEPECINPERGSLNPERGSPKPSRTIKEPSDKPSARDHLLSVVSEETADGFIEMRKLIKKPLTAHAAKLIANEIGGNPQAEAMVQQSIKNSWQGVFPVKANLPGGNGQGQSERDRQIARYNRMGR